MSSVAEGHAIPHSVYDCSGVPVFYIYRHQKPCYTCKLSSRLHHLTSISLCYFTASRYSCAPERREQAYPALGFTTFSIIPHYSTPHCGTSLFSLEAHLTSAFPNICLRLTTLASDWIFVERLGDTVTMFVSFSYHFLYSTLGVLPLTLHPFLLRSQAIQSVSGDGVLDKVGVVRMAIRAFFWIFGTLCFRLLRRNASRGNKMWDR